MIDQEPFCDDRCDDGQLLRMLRNDPDDLDSKHLDSKHLDSKHLDSKHLDSKHLDSKHLNSKHRDSKHLNSKHLDSKHLNSKHRDSVNRDSESGNSSEMLDHVENCQRCQQRLDELAADESEWQKTVEVLSGNARDAATDGPDGLYPSLHMSRIHLRPPAWTESMARQLLSPPSHPEMLGRIGRYDVERLIGSGGMGVVFKAYDTELNRPVAVKLLAPYLASSGAARSRFAREARAAAAVVDEHVVPIHNVESDGEPPFLVMKYIAGGSLQMRLDRDGPLEVCEVLRIGMHTAKGLAAAHAQGLIHRDVKPSNILLDEGVERALLTDFGLARAADDASLTRSGFHPGTPHYMSPEQVRGEAIDGRSDLFGLGCVLYALCTGHPPFRSETSYAVLRRITDDTPRPIRETNPTIPPWLEQIVMKLLAKSPDDRFDSAEQVAELLEGCLAHVQQPTTRPLPTPLAAMSGQRNRRPPIGKFSVAAAFAFSLICAGVLLVLELNKGTLTIESDADDVAIRIMQGDETVQRLMVSREGKTTRLRAGPYTIVFDGPVTDYTITDSKVVLKRGETEVAKVTLAVDPLAAAKPLNEEKTLFGAAVEFNNLHPNDGQGRPQPPLSSSEVSVCLQWRLGNGDFSEEVKNSILSMIYDRKRLVPEGWALSGGLTRHRCKEGVIQTWEVNLETNGLSSPIPIRRMAIAPPAALRKPTETLSDDESATPLTTAIDRFNASHDKIDRRGSLPLVPPPLTLDEVLAGIALWQTKRDEADVDDATFQRFQRIARTHQLPSDVSFEVIPTLKNKIGKHFFVWSIRILVPQVAQPGSTYAFTIRHQFLGWDTQNISATHWGSPGKNGIQAGFRLIPAQRSYRIGQVVDIEFLYRNITGKEIPATLPAFFRYRKNRFTGHRIDIQKKIAGNDIRTTIGGQPTVLKGQRIQFCADLEDEVGDGVGSKVVVVPGKNHRMSFVVSNPGDGASDEELETGRSYYFNTPYLTPPKLDPVFTGHWYLHWGSGVPRHRRPKESTPDPEYIDPFQFGVSLGPADRSRIPAYYASGLKVTKVAPYSPAQSVGIEVGDILLSWEKNQIYGDDPSKPFFYKWSQKLLREELEKNAKYSGWATFNMKFDLLDHRTGEVIGIAPWFGFSASGGPNKAELIKRMLERKRLRSTVVDDGKSLGANSQK